LAFVIGDGLSGDQLCGRYKNYSHHVARLSRACDVSFDNSNKPDWVCNYLKMSALQELSICALELSGFIVNENDDAIPNFQRQVQLNEHFEKLKKLAHHMHDNAFDTVWFGENDHGILGTCPTDLMHAFLHGLIPYVVKIVINTFMTSDKHKLDLLVDDILVPA